MICGIGIDMTTIDRFASWIDKPELIDRFFNSREKCYDKSTGYMKEHYAVRFAAKEAFGKALGTGITGFNLCDLYIQNDKAGKPELIVTGSARQKLEQMYGDCRLFVSLTHEKNNAVAVVIIEK